MHRISEQQIKFDREALGSAGSELKSGKTDTAFKRRCGRGCRSIDSELLASLTKPNEGTVLNNAICGRILVGDQSLQYTYAAAIRKMTCAIIWASTMSR
ncbi:hypothetical protein [Aureliella helgolandensis]|uniref:Uncharacterized protein n=1 Tax=Aureliella helgolandensis TaxID=2527968 RepID=A0A518GBM7_9BACT|nr:hypothetical protein [Aureliella helgolandensis]QDV25998.1 hypothetical protein Q31a_43680 [Aureliella helgolandensis]